MGGLERAGGEMQPRTTLQRSVSGESLGKLRKLRRLRRLCESEREGRLDQVLLKGLVRISGLAITVLGLALLAFYALQNFSGYTSERPAEGTGGSPPTTQSAEDESPAGPENKTLELTVPKANVEDAIVPTSPPTEAALRDNAAVRLPGTGLPWQQVANVYIAGHELGYPFTDSFRAFYELKKVEKGDEIYLTDAAGTRYTYEVFEVIIVQPGDLWVLDPLPERNIVSLQVSETQQKQEGVTPKRVVRGELIQSS